MASQLRGIDVLHYNITLGHDWLLEMGVAAERLGMSIQYSSAYPRQVLQALQIKSVTQVYEPHCAVTAKLICVFVFAYEKSWFSYDEASWYLAFCKKYKSAKELVISVLASFVLNLK